MDTRAALEAALAQSWHDLTLHAAYADFLIEQGDPRGEYIRLDLLMRAPGTPEEDRDKLREDWAAVRDAHQNEWLAPLLDFVGDPGRPFFGCRLRVEWKLGWAHRLIYGEERNEYNQTLAVGDAPDARARREALQTPKPDAARHFFAALAALPAAKFLEMLYWTDQAIGTAGVAALVASGLIDRLSVLQLGSGDVDDDGIDVLMACPAVKNLSALNLSGNLVTDDGATALARGLAGGRVEYLNLEVNHMSPIGVAELESIRGLKNLRTGVQRRGRSFGERPA